MGARRVLASLTAVSVVRRESAVEVTDAKEGFRPGIEVETCETFEGEVSDAGPTLVGVFLALINREALKLVAGPPSPSLSLVMKPEVNELTSSTEPLRMGREMLDRDIGLRREGLVMEKLLGGAAPRIDLRALAAIPARAESVLVVEAGAVCWLEGAPAPVCVELDTLEVSEICDSLRCSGRETRLAVEPIC